MNRTISALFSISFLVATSISAQAGALEKTKITMAIAGTSSQIYFLAVNVAKSLGYFKDEGLEVETVDFAGGAKALQALVGGSADIDAGSYEHTLQMQAKGQDIKCFVLYGRSVGTVLAVSSKLAKKYKSVTDLKGLKVGVSAPGFSATNIYLNLILAKAGMKPDDVSVVGVGNGPIAVAAIENDKIDAISSVDPVISQLTRAGSIKVVVDSRTDQGLNEIYGGEYASGCLLATGKFISENPNTVQALTKAIVRSLKWIKASSPAKILEVLPKDVVGPDSDLYQASIEKNLNTVAANGIISSDAAKNVLRIVTEADRSLSAANIDLQATYTNRFTEKALQDPK